VLLRDARALNLLSLGDETARSSGGRRCGAPPRLHRPPRCCRAVVSLCGIITFAGLVVPHVLRRLLGSDCRLLLPASFFGGAASWLPATHWPLVSAPAELPVAHHRSAGAPFFVYLLRRARCVRAL